MAFKYGNRDQLTFLPDSIETYVGDDDPVRVYDAFLDALNLESLGLNLNDKQVGHSSYDPRVMMKILVYGYSYGWRSSRKLERALHHNLSFIWLAGGLKPDHKTISNFRKNNKSALKSLLKQTVEMCLKLGVIEGNVLFVDGSKFRSNAGISQTKSKSSWEKQLKKVENQIDNLLEECDKIDSEDSGSLVQVNKELRSKSRLKAKIIELVKEIDDNQQVNGTDPESKIMKSRQGTHTGYNCQMVVDHQNGLIVSLQAEDQANDKWLLQKHVAKAEEILGKKCETVCADAGYSVVDDGKQVIVPNQKQASKTQKNNPFDKDNFIYNTQTDQYTCPEGEQLYRSYHERGTNKIIYRMKVRGVCKNCQFYGTCTKAKQGRTIRRLINEETKDELAAIYESQEGQEIYRARKMKAELPFGHFKRNLGAGAFLLRGFDGVNTELSILSTCFNFSRLLTITGGTKNLIEILKTSKI